MRRPRARDERGFTLIEIAIGMAVLGLGVVSALQVFGGSMRLARNASRLTEAVVHARALMDAVLSMPELDPKIANGSGEIGDGFRWTREVTIASPDDGIELENDEEVQTEITLAVITVLVEWNEPSGVKAYRIGTMRVIPNYGEAEVGQ